MVKIITEASVKVWCSVSLPFAIRVPNTGLQALFAHSGLCWFFKRFGFGERKPEQPWYLHIAVQGWPEQWGSASVLPLLLLREVKPPGRLTLRGERILLTPCTLPQPQSNHEAQPEESFEVFKHIFLVQAGFLFSMCLRWGFLTCPHNSFLLILGLALLPFSVPFLEL